MLLEVNTRTVSRSLVTRLMSPNTVSVVSDDDDDDRDGDMVTVGSEGALTELDNKTVSGMLLVQEDVVGRVSLTSSLSRNNKHVYIKNYNLCKSVIA